MVRYSLNTATSDFGSRIGGFVATVLSMKPPGIGSLCRIGQVSPVVARLGQWSVGFLILVLVPMVTAATFNVRDYGATGRKPDNVRAAIQKTIDACAAAGGGTVYFPPGDYTSGTLHLRSRVRIEIPAGATVFASTDPKEYEFDGVPSKASLFYGNDVEDVAFVGEGTVHGQAEYEWREDDFEKGFNHKETMISLGKSLMRSFPKGHPQREVFPHLVWLGRSKRLTFSGLNWLHSPSWSITLYDCEKATFDGLYVHTSLKDGVWADGIDLDSCRDVTISDCRIETGDDCVVFISTDAWGPAKLCENIVVRRCRLSSASAGVKFSEGNRVGIRNVQVVDSVLTNVNRGFVFSTTLGGFISDVVLSNLVIHCNRFDWFWAGDGQPFFFRVTRLSEFNKQPAKPDEPPPGLISNIRIQNVEAHGKGSARIHGHPENPITGLRMENVKLRMSADTNAPFDYAEHGLDVRWVKNSSIQTTSISWNPPHLPQWRDALHLEEVRDVEIDGFTGQAAHESAAAIHLANGRGVKVGNSAAAGDVGAFLNVVGAVSSGISVVSNDLRRAKVPWRRDPAISADVISDSGNQTPSGWKR